MNLMKSEYYPSHSQNRMKHEGDVLAARKYFMTGKNRVLYYLIRQRFSWMNKYIKPSDKVIIELGCGAGLSKRFIENKNYTMTDVSDYEWVDRYLDAMDLDLPDNSVDVFVCSHMIHHISNPAKFLDDLGKKLKPDGRILIQDIYTCALMKAALRMMRHEGWSDRVAIFDRNAICNDPADPWSANCSIPKLLFFDKSGGVFEEQFPQYEIIRRSRNECFLFFASGGVIAKTFYLPLGDRAVKYIKKIDRFLVKILPSVFACGCSVVIKKRE